MKKEIIYSILTAAALLVGCSSSDKALTPDGNEGWKPLFAADLSNAEYDKDVWSVKPDGTLVSTQDKVIFTKDDYENFEISLDYKIEKNSNSGIVIYCTDTKKWIPNSLEIQICDNEADKYRSRGNTWLTGALFGHAAPSITENMKPIGEWNNMVVSCRGQIIDVTLNGKKINHIDLSKWTQKDVNPDGSKIPTWLTAKIKSQVPTKGKIGLQGKHGGAATDFRNVKIRPLK